MAVTITPDDVAALAPGLDPARVAALIDGAMATAILAAPCLAEVDQDSPQAKAAKLIIVGAIARMAGNASGAAASGVQQESAGPFAVRYGAVVGTFSDKELRSLKAICGGGKAFALDTAPDWRPGPDRWHMSERKEIPADVLTLNCESCLL